MTNNLVSQAATIQLGKVPNDVISNLNPISIIIFVPFMTYIVYPVPQRMKIRFTPIKRIAYGFLLASLAMASACVTQYYIYKDGPCGDHSNGCLNADGDPRPALISVWVQTVPFALIGFSEIMASVTSLEYVFTKAPTKMRSTVQAVSLFMTAISSALSQALVGLSDDPLLIWNYGFVAVLAAIAGILFYLDNRQLDKDEDKLNILPSSVVNQREVAVTEEERGRAPMRDNTLAAAPETPPHNLIN